MKATKEDSSGFFVDRFRKSLMNVCKILNNHGAEVVPFHDEGLALYGALPSAQKQRTLKFLEIYESILERSQAGGVSLRKNKEFLWIAIKDLDLRQPSSMFDFIDDSGDMTVEIYDLDGIQIWRNLYMSMCSSYTIEEDYCLPWHVRYERAQENTDRIMCSVQKVIRASEPRVFAEMIPYHILKERSSAKRLIARVRHDYLCPVFNKDHSVAGFVAVSRGRVLGSAFDEKPLQLFP